MLHIRGSSVCVIIWIPTILAQVFYDTAEPLQDNAGSRSMLKNLKIGIVGGGVQLGPLGTAATNGLLCQPRVIMMMEKLVE
jgi:hypothetical protein